MEDEIMDVAGDTSTQEILEVGGSVSSDLFGEGDTDFFAITIEAGQTINFSQSNVAIPNLGREVTLQDSDGNVVASGPEVFRFGTVDNLDFAFQAEETGTFFLSIESTDNFTAPTAGTEFGQGDYTISATEIADDFSNFVSIATQLEAGNNEINGDLEYLGDADVFTVFLNAGDTISTNVETSVFTDRTLIGPDGNVLVGGPGQASLANGFTVSEAGLYAVSIEASFEVNRDFRSPLDETGEYNLQINVEPGDSLPGDGTIEGTDGNDNLAGTSGNDEILGLDGDDTLDGLGGNDLLNGGEGDDILQGRAGDDTLFGGFGNDNIVGGAGNDYLVGEDGADVFTFGEGDNHDTIADFEIGVDSISISIDSDSFIANFTDVIENGVLQDFTRIENLLSQDGNDTLIGLGADNSIRLLDTQLDNLLAGEAPSTPTPTPTEDPDAIIGTSADDTLNGTAGDDVIFGEGGNDAIFGSAGDDIIDSGAGNDYLVGGDGADVFVFNEGDGHDTIDGFEIGVDSLEISGVRIDELSDISPLLSQDGQDVLIGLSAEQSIRLLNTSLDDVLNGGTADNVITGTNGNDNLIGTDGVDIIDGGTGNDLLVGGEGDDVFVLAQGDGFNRISDFQAGEDVINLTDFGFDDFGDVNLVENNNTVFLYLGEDTSVELTGIESVDELSVDDFVL